MLQTGFALVLEIHLGSNRSRARHLRKGHLQQVLLVTDVSEFQFGRCRTTSVPAVSSAE